MSEIVPFSKWFPSKEGYVPDINNPEYLKAVSHINMLTGGLIFELGSAAMAVLGTGPLAITGEFFTCAAVLWNIQASLVGRFAAKQTPQVPISQEF